MTKDRTDVLTTTCRECRRTVTLRVDPDGHRRWLQGEYVQVAFSYLTPDERQILISQICGSCFDKMFPDDDDNVRADYLTDRPEDYSSPHDSNGDA